MSHMPKGRFAVWLGGVIACLVLLGAGIAYIVVGVNGRNEVSNTVAREHIVGTPDMTPTLIREEIAKSGLKNVSDVPTCTVAGKAVKNGETAKCFASYMRIHALLASNGQTYAQMGQFLMKDGTPTSDETKAAIDPVTKKPVQNTARNTWVTETALTTGLNMAFFAEQVSMFGIVMGICMLVIGVGLGILTVYIFGLAPWRTPGEVPADPAPATK
jgi:hypothetical protein